MELMRIDKGYAGVRVQSNGVLHSVLLLAGAREASQRIAAGFWSDCRGPLRLRSGQAFDYTGNPPSRVAGSPQDDKR